MKTRTVWLPASIALLCGIAWWLFDRAESTASDPVRVANSAKNSPAAGASREAFPVIATVNSANGHSLPSQNTAVDHDPSVPLQVTLGVPIPMQRAGSWQNVGRASLAAAVQSQYWAISGGNIDYIEKAIVLHPDARQAMQSLLETMPDSIRSQYPTPDRLAAFLLSGESLPKGFLLSRQDPKTSDETTVFVGVLRPGTHKFVDERQDFERQPDGSWARVITFRTTKQWVDKYGGGSGLATPGPRP